MRELVKGPRPDQKQTRANRPEQSPGLGVTLAAGPSSLGHSETRPELRVSRERRGQRGRMGICQSCLCTRQEQVFLLPRAPGKQPCVHETNDLIGIHSPQSTMSCLAWDTSAFASCLSININMPLSCSKCPHSDNKSGWLS